MPVYNDLRPQSDFKDRHFERIFPDMTRDDQLRTIEGLLRLKAGLMNDLPPRRTEANLIVGSWNIVKFGASHQRLPESYFYIAEVIAAYDLIAIQEVKPSLMKLEKVVSLLGPDWAYMVNDVTEGAAGNQERSAYVYNTKRVRLSGLAGEITLWKELTDPLDADLEQLSRAPFMTGFVTGWKKFAMVNLHLEPNASSKAVKVRTQEVNLLLAALEKKRKGLWSDNLVLVGDMNFYADKDDENITSLLRAGFLECEGLKGKPTNVHIPDPTRDQVVETYDRMFFRANNYFRFGLGATGKPNGDVFDPYRYVFRPEDEDTYRDIFLSQYGGSKDLASNADQRRDYYLDTWRENQLSDHYPIWAELEIDDSLAFLEEKKGDLVG